MGVRISSKEEIEKYFNSPALGQSTLKGLLDGFDEFKAKLSKEESRLFYEEKTNLIIGSAVDCILTGEEGQFDKEYHISEVSKPSEIEMSITQKVFDKIDISLVKDKENIALEDYLEYVKESILEHNWQQNWKEETKVKKIVEKCSEYFKDLIVSFGKQVLSIEEKTLVDSIVKSLTTNPLTSQYFNRQEFSSRKDVDIYYQLPIYFKHGGVECKALLDMLIVIKSVETGVIEKAIPVDLKTMYGYTSQFIQNFKRFRYDIQAAWYTLAVQNCMAELKQKLQPEAEDIHIENFRFIVESTSNVGKPLVYEVDDEILHIGRFGRNKITLNQLLPEAPKRTIQHGVKGFETLLKEYVYCMETAWEENMYIANNMQNGILRLSWEGITKNEDNKNNGTY